MNLKYMKDKIKDLLYKKFISKGLQDIRKEYYDKGYEHGKHEFDEKLDWLVNEKYTSKDWLVNPDGVLTVSDKGIMYLNGEQISDLEKKGLKAEVQALKSFKLWEIMQETLRQKAIEKAVLTSTDYEQVLAGKMMIHNLGIIKSIVDAVDKYKF